MAKPNVLFIMTDQQRWDTIGALGNPLIRTPNLDRLVHRGIAFSNAYSSCPVCAPARYGIRTGRQPWTTGYYGNGMLSLSDRQNEDREDRCGIYLPRRMGELGYRTFGIGKFHTYPRDEEIGFDFRLHTGENYRCDYARYVEENHPEYAHIEQLHGERTDMYYMPQTSALPAHLKVESWVADRAIEQISKDDDNPYFGFVSFIGPHPPFAPPVPYNRLYDPDSMPNPVCGDMSLDHMDETIPWMNYCIWADEISPGRARALKARYYGYISFIDDCIGRIIDAVASRKDADDTLICFFSDHGEHLGDHHGWQKESFYEASAGIPFLLSWPARLPSNKIRNELVSLVDLYGIATSEAGRTELRDGCDILGLVRGTAPPRSTLFALYGMPGTPLFKIMVREGDWKYIFMANGGREQLFNLREDPDEGVQRLGDSPLIAAELRRKALDELTQHSDTAVIRAIDGRGFKLFDFCTPRDYERIVQMAKWRGVSGFTSD